MSNHKETMALILEELTLLDEYAQKISRLEGDKFTEMHTAITDRFNNKINPIAARNTSKQLQYVLYEIYTKLANKGMMYNEFFRDEIYLLEDLIKNNK
jgi:hypothetical protein